MFDVGKMIEEIGSKRKSKTLVSVGCGGSLACFLLLTIM